MLSLLHLTLSMLLLVSGALQTTATPQASSTDSALEPASSETVDASSAFSPSQSLTSTGDGVDHASAFTLPSPNDDSSSDPATSLFEQPISSAGDGIDRASAITLTEPTSTLPDGNDHAHATTFQPSTSSTPEGVDHAPAITLLPPTTSSTSTTPTSTSTLFVTPPPVYTTVTVPPPFVNTTTQSTSSTISDPTPAASETPGSAERFCPWCHGEIPPSEGTGECNLVIQLPGRQREADATGADTSVEMVATKGERFPWAVLNWDFSEMLDVGLVKRDKAVVVSLGGGRVQMSGNRVWVARGGPHLVYNDMDMPPTHQGWREHNFAAPGREEGTGNVTVWRISFDCSQGVTCEFGGRCHVHEEL